MDAMTDQEHALAMAEQARNLRRHIQDALPFHAATAISASMGIIDAIIAGALSLTADTARQAPAFSCDYQRMWDLVRSQRGELLDAELITREEYAALLSEETKDRSGQGSPSARRLESYDELRAKLVTADTARAQAFEEGRKAERELLIADFDRRVQMETNVVKPGLLFAAGLIALRARATTGDTP